MTDFLQLAKERFSVRQFAAAPVEKEKLDLILEAGRVAPTAKNNQPQKVYVLQTPEQLAKIRSVCPCAYNAPLVLVIGYDNDRDWKNNLQPGYHSGETDAAIVCTHMMMEAWDLGIGSCWVGWFNAQEVHDTLGLPANVTVTALLPLGYIPEGGKASGNHLAIRPAEDTIVYL